MELALLTRAIYPLHGYGGMERHCYDWIQAMSARGCRIHAITMPPLQPESLAEYAANVQFYFIPGRPARRILQRITSYPAWIRRVNTFLKSFVQQANIKAIYAQGLAAAACKNVAVPVVYNPHGMEEFKTAGLKYLAYAPFRAMSREGARLAQTIVATDSILVPEIERYFGATKDRIAVIPNAVDLRSPQECGSVIPFHGDPLFMAAGRLEANKGLHILIKALAIAKNLPPEWRLVIAGGGSQEHALKDLAQRTGLRARIAFAGELPEVDLCALYSRADVFLNPTLFEGSSLVTLEAMKHSLPVVASRTGGIPDKVHPGTNGWLVPPGDISALAQAIETACAQKEKWKEMGAESRRIVEKQFSWDVAAERFLDLFRKSF